MNKMMEGSEGAEEREETGGSGGSVTAAPPTVSSDWPTRENRETD